MATIPAKIQQGGTKTEQENMRAWKLQRKKRKARAKKLLFVEMALARFERATQHVTCQEALRYATSADKCLHRKGGHIL